MIKSKKGRWYIKQGERIHGPFPNKLIGRYLIIGRINLDTEVSQDQEHWAAVKQYPAMVPDVVKEAGTPEGDRALMLARVREDERSSKPNSQQAGDERRADEDQVMQLHRQIRDDVWMRRAWEPNKFLLYGGIALFILLILIGLYYASFDQGSARLADCDSPPHPGINWSGCNKVEQVLRGQNLQQVVLRNAKLHGADLSAARLQSADLAYADLSQAILVAAQMQNVTIKAANLRQANLQEANLSGANFSYAELVGAKLQGADLTGAVFDHAIWVNGRTCLPGSVGACLLPAED